MSEATTVVPTRNSTATTLPPVAALALAASDTEDPMLVIRPTVGAVSETEAALAATAVTETGEDKT